MKKSVKVMCELKDHTISPTSIPSISLLFETKRPAHFYDMANNMLNRKAVWKNIHLIKQRTKQVLMEFIQIEIVKTTHV